MEPQLPAPAIRLIGANAISGADAALSEEHQYLSLLTDIITHGEYRFDRTGTGTLSLFSPAPLRFQLSRPTTLLGPSENSKSASQSLDDYELVIPLLTTRRLATRLIIAELLWFISGNTSAKPLQEQNIHIWDGNGSREFLDRVGLSHHDEGDLGPVYGFQWRHFGAEYEGADVMHGTKYKGKGVDQLAEVIRMLQTDQVSRRILLSAWNVADLSKMALPPCHLMAQFYVSFPGRRPPKEGQRKEVEQVQGVLHSVLYQRSADCGLGLPFNIASYSLLTHMLAHVCGLRPGTFTVVLGDAHVYLDHVDTLKEQLKRAPKRFPGMDIKRPRRTDGQLAKVDDIDGWSVGDFTMRGYEPHGKLDMKMSV